MENTSMRNRHQAVQQVTGWLLVVALAAGVAWLMYIALLGFSG